MNDARLLLVEEAPATRMLLDTRLRAAGYTVITTGSAEQALALLGTERFALLISEIHLPGLNGIELMTRARKLDPDLELIVLTGGATVESAVAALNLGARAYLRKPVVAGELEQQVATALQRRHERLSHHATLRQLGSALLRIAEPHSDTYHTAAPQPDAVQVGQLRIDARRRRAAIGERVVPLSSGEFDLLLYLARREGEVLPAEQLARDVLGYSCSSDEARELIKARVHRLRHKIEPNPRTPTLLVSVRGAGYMLTGGE